MPYVLALVSLGGYRPTPPPSVVSFPPAMERVLPHVLPFLLAHEPLHTKRVLGPIIKTEWCPDRHDGDCGQSCGCCRSHNIEDGCVCEECYFGWTLTCVSTNCFYQARMYAQGLRRCFCRGCSRWWLRRGWICPDDNMNRRPDASVSVRIVRSVE